MKRTLYKCVMRPNCYSGFTLTMNAQNGILENIPKTESLNIYKSSNALV